MRRTPETMQMDRCTADATGVWDAVSALPREVILDPGSLVQSYAALPPESSGPHLTTLTNAQLLRRDRATGGPVVGHRRFHCAPRQLHGSRLLPSKATEHRRTRRGFMCSDQSRGSVSAVRSMRRAGPASLVSSCFVIRESVSGQISGTDSFSGRTRRRSGSPDPQRTHVLVLDDPVRPR